MLSFGDCLFDPERRVLLRGGQVIHLTPKAFQMLELLLERRPAALSKEEIIGRLWPDTFVSDGSLANLVAEIREATGDDARHPRVVRTVQRFGYAFCGDAQEVTPLGRPRHRFVSPEGEFALHEGESLIGRAMDCVVHLDDSSVSRHHARLSIVSDQATLQDLDSKNGTFVRGQRLSAPVVLRDRDQIDIGSVKLIFRVSSPQTSTDTSIPLGEPDSPSGPKGRKR